MEHISFMKVSVEEAKAALHADTAPIRLTSHIKKQWEAKRNVQHAIIQDLAINTFKWLASLPREARPKALALRFPRITNRIAEIWERPLQCERYLDELLIDLRGGRRGFPPDVAADIAKLKAHFLSTRKIVHFGVWGDRIGMD